MCLGGGGSGGDGGARAAEEARQARVRDGVARINTNFEKFNDDFYGQRSQAYLDYATPQVEDQWKKAQEQLTFALGRAGLLNSTVAGARQGDARLDYERQIAAVRDAATDQGTQARNDVERARSDLISQATSTADPTAAATGAQARATALAQQPGFSPLGPLFQNVTAGLATGLEAQRAKADNERYGTRGATIFGSSGGRNSGRVVN
jgi:hypothetical protein